MNTTNHSLNDISTELSDPIFDIMDENDDELEYTTDELNRYYLEDSYLYPWIDNEETIENDLIDDFNDDLPLQEEEQEVLSQRLSQLSTNHDNDEPTTATMNKRPRLSMTSDDHHTTIKKPKINCDHNDNNDPYEAIDENENENEIPKYLLLTNPLFVRMIRNFIDTTTSSPEIVKLQKFAIYVHHIKTLQLQKQISTTYLLSGTGQLGSSEFELVPVDRRVWPIQVKNVLIEQQKNLSSITTMEINHDQDDHATCEALVRQRLKETDEKIDYYQKKCDEIKNHFMETNSNIEIAIEHYVQQYGIQVVQLKSNLKKALIKYDYDTEILERQYKQQKPNEYQIQIAQHLYEKRAEAEKAKRTLKELKYRIFYNRPLFSLDSIENSKTTANNTSTTTTTINSETSQQQSWLNTYEKQIERKKMNLMAMYIAKAESQFYQCQKIFDDELSRMWQNHRNLVKNQGMTTTLIHLIERRLALITEKFRQIYNYRFDYYLQNDQQQQQQRIGFSTSLIIDTTHHTLTKKEIQLLNRGPSYVPPYQLSISSSMTTNDEIIKRKYAPLKHQLATLFSKYHINIAVSMDIEQKINEQFKNLFSISLPSTIRQ
ncbi:unnamed protein product [Rotaria magnacalcarata]|uniref:Uncharacterized protein n=5 Tax=Rotaria magnacalcarata TaxID=392030 RepID=A0A816MRB1_9BILA|nr:unnamed protein product [Rotaria magnacalcarata]CAF4207667.1 unnamed protein product [Rotaria magnacalcarata]